MLTSEYVPCDVCTGGQTNKHFCYCGRTRLLSPHDYSKYQKILKQMWVYPQHHNFPQPKLPRFRATDFARYRNKHKIIIMASITLRKTPMNRFPKYL